MVGDDDFRRYYGLCGVLLFVFVGFIFFLLMGVILWGMRGREVGCELCVGCWYRVSV